jgi:hypothetical protein
MKRPSEYVAHWIGHWCVNPDGEPVALTPVEHQIIARLYDAPPGSVRCEPLGGRLAAYLVLVHIASRLASSDHAPPALLHADIFTVWNAMGPRLREVLRREGETIVCRELGTRWPDDDHRGGTPPQAAA